MAFEHAFGGAYLSEKPEPRRAGRRQLIYLIFLIGAVIVLDKGIKVYIEAVGKSEHTDRVFYRVNVHGGVAYDSYVESSVIFEGRVFYGSGGKDAGLACHKASSFRSWRFHGAVFFFIISFRIAIGNG